MPIETMMYAVGGVFVLVFLIVVVGIVKKSRSGATGAGSRRGSDMDFDDNWSDSGGGGD